MAKSLFIKLMAHLWEVPLQVKKYEPTPLDRRGNALPQPTEMHRPGVVMAILKKKKHLYHYTISERLTSPWDDGHVYLMNLKRRTQLVA